MMENKQTGNAAIEQLNMSYHNAEDRLLFRIGLSNNQEIIVWLTRRSCKILMPLLDNIPLANDKSSEKYLFSDPKLTEELTKNEITQKLDFSSHYKQRQLVNKGQLFLINDCRLSKNGTQSVLELICTNKQSIKLNLNDKLLMALINMLQMAVRHADWELQLTTMSPALNTKSTRRLH